jgi:hypothetical protein
MKTQPFVKPRASGRRQGRLAIASYVVGAVLLFAIALFPRDDQRKSWRGAAARDVESIATQLDVALQPKQRRAAHLQPEKTFAAPVIEGPEELRGPEERGAQLAQKFAANGAPSSLMLEAQDAFVSIFSKGVVGGAQLSSMECRTTMCRAQVAFSGWQSDQHFFRYAFLDPATRIGQAVDVSVPVRTTAANGTVSATVYLLKAEPVLAQANEDSF